MLTYEDDTRTNGVIEVYEKYKHLDRVLSDPQFYEGSAMAHVAHELWLVIKEAAEQNAQPTLLESGQILHTQCHCPSCYRSTTMLPQGG